MNRPEGVMPNGDLFMREAQRRGARNGNPLEVSRRPGLSWGPIIALLACAAFWAGFLGWRMG